MKQQLEHYRGNEEFVRRVEDWIDQSQRQYRRIATPFLTPAQQEIVCRLCGKRVPFVLVGGYEDAELKRAIFLPYEEEVEESEYICILRFTYQEKFVKLEHRDVLGAILNSGIKKEQLGDLIVEKDALYVIVSREIAEYLQIAVTQIKRVHVQFKIYEGVVSFVKEIKREQQIVSSVRLDSIVSACAHISRKKAQDLIRAGLVKVNHVVLEQTSRLCNNNSTISIRGYGRFLFYGIVKETRKENFVIEIGKYV